MRERLTLDEALEMLTRMASEADKENDLEYAEGNIEQATFWDGWAGGLLTLKNHIETGVKVTCFPIGGCKCHPFDLKRG